MPCLGNYTDTSEDSIEIIFSDLRNGFRHSNDFVGLDEVGRVYFSIIETEGTVMMKIGFTHIM